MTLTISKKTRRRFILGKQGLWPGRRWRGMAGTAAALDEIQALQVDPVTVVAQSHDLMLYGRVLDYRPAILHDLLYKQRRFFDYGGGLMIYPMHELPYWLPIMERMKAVNRWADFRGDNKPVIEKVKSELRKRGPLRSRDLEGKPVNAYRGSKDTSLALYYLWLTGELMTYRREGKERVYGFRDGIAPAEYNRPASVSEAERYFARKTISHHGIVSEKVFRNKWMGYIGRDVDQEEANEHLAGMLVARTIGHIKIKDKDEKYYVAAQDLDLLETLEAGAIPEGWQATETTSDEEVVFLSPLEYTTARGRARVIFNFDYKWEIYKPAAKRVYGPYTMPILYGDRLPARMDSRMDRSSGTLEINGIWMEDWFEATPEFAAAFAKGLNRLGGILGAVRANFAQINPDLLRKIGQHSTSHPIS